MGFFAIVWNSNIQGDNLGLGFFMLNQHGRLVEQLVSAHYIQVALEELVPEFLFTELPRKFHLHIEDIQVSSTKLGGGAAGSVFKVIRHSTFSLIILLIIAE